MGAKYLGRNVDALATEGRLVVIGMQGGSKGELDLGMLLRKRGAVIATALRARPTEEKATIAASVVEHVWPLVADGRVRPVVHATLPLDRAAEAHRLIEDERPRRQDRAHPLTSRLGVMSENPAEEHIVIIGPDGQPVGSVPSSAVAAAQQRSEAPREDDEERHITELVEQPAKVMRIGSMIRQLLEEVKAAPLDEASRQRLKEIHQSSIKELEAGLAPELVEELERLSLPFTDATPSESELRIAQAQLVGWLEGLFHGIQTAIYAQQMAARAQLEQMRRALPPGVAEAMGHQGPPQPPGQEGPGTPGPDGGTSGGMYL